MAQYHTRAAQLKPQVEAANFTSEQLTLIHKMMRGCTMLRQGSVIDSFLSCMLPDKFEMKQGDIVQGQYGAYRPLFVVEKGQAVPQSTATNEELD